MYITHNRTSSFTERGVTGGRSDERPPTTEVVMIHEKDNKIKNDKLNEKDSLNYEVQKLYNIWRYCDVSTSILSMIGLLIGIIDVSAIKI